MENEGSGMKVLFTHFTISCFSVKNKDNNFLIKEKTMKHPHLFRALVLISLITFAIGLVAAPQTQFTVGQRIEYKDKSYPAEVWKEGTIVKVMPEYNQVLVRWDPRDDYPSYTHNGVSSYEQAYSMDNVRPIKPKTQKAAAGNNGGKGKKGNAKSNGKKNAAKPKPANNAGGKGLMSKQEILGYMKTHGYVNGQPKKDLQVCRDLIEIMKKRGVREPLRAGTDDLSPINDNACAGGVNTDVTEASVVNLGVPPTINWLAGTWTLTVFGDTVYTAPGNGYIYRHGPKTGTQGSLTISAKGSYTWNDGKGHLIKGAWRYATSQEMKMQGGAGIVLRKAAQGRDWLVFKYQSRVPNKTDRIEVEDLQYGGSSRWIGWRK
jgi:hypothetical protein